MQGLTKMSRGQFLAVSALAAAIIGASVASLQVSAQDVTSSAANAATTVGKADIERGEALFDLCTYCHGEAGLGNPKLGAPAIAGMSEWYINNQLRSFRAGGRGRHPDDAEGMRMRPMSLTLRIPGDLESVAAYTASLPAQKPAPSVEGGNAARGAQLFATCIACHGPDAAGNQALNAPPLTHLSDWYMIKQLQKFRAGIRGTDPKDTYGLLMRPMALTLSDDQAVKDVVAHILTLSK